MLLALLVLIISCTAKQRYDYLSFFIDDVPPPESSKVGKDTLNTNDNKNALTSNQPKANQKIDTIYTHPPAEEESCNNCHVTDNSNALNEKLPKLCYNCHDDFSKKYKFLHGPLLSGGCTECHDPHKSAIKPLLKAQGQDLCFYCHEKESVLKNTIHSDIGDTKCWDCHSPHGGSDRTFMK